MKLHDVTVPIWSGMHVYEGDPPVSISPSKTLARDGVNVSRLDFGTHTGTHMDAPSHFIPGGKTIDAIDPNRCGGPCRVLDLTDAGDILRRVDLEKFDLKRGERIVLKTKNSELWDRDRFTPDFAALDLYAAKYCVEAGILLIGIDYLSVEPFGSGAKGHPVHKALLAEEIAILEGLDLRGVAPGNYRLHAFPLRLKGLDGGQCRTFLESDENHGSQALADEASHA